MILYILYTCIAVEWEEGKAYSVYTVHVRSNSYCSILCIVLWCVYSSGGGRGGGDQILYCFMHTSVVFLL